MNEHCLSAIKGKKKHKKQNINKWKKHRTQFIIVISSIFLVDHRAFFNQRVAKSFPGIKANEWKRPNKKKTSPKGILKQRLCHFSAPEMSLTQSGNHWLTYPFQFSACVGVFLFLLFFFFALSAYTKSREFFKLFQIFHRKYKISWQIIKFSCFCPFNCKLFLFFYLSVTSIHIWRVICTSCSSYLWVYFVEIEFLFVKFYLLSASNICIC